MNLFTENGTGCFEIEEWADTTKFTKCESSRTWKQRLFGRRKKGVHKVEAEIVSRVGSSSEWVDISEPGD